MAVDRAEAQTLFQYALARVRQGGTNAGGQARIDTNELYTQMWDRFNDLPNVRGSDVKAAVGRAVAARELALRMTQSDDGQLSPTAREYPNVPVMDRRRGDYQYQVVIEMRGQGVSDDFRVRFQSRLRLSAQEVMERAQDMWDEQTSLQNNYRNRVRALGTEPTPQFYIVAASRYVPGRTETK